MSEPGNVLEDVHLVSWNVSGWRKTADLIASFGNGLVDFLAGHRIDILCLQETKLTSAALRKERTLVAPELAGYESFWACNDGASGQRLGLNGVATFVRRGRVLRADATPLGSLDLDGEGRCLLTDHGPFVVFNAYVPNTAGGTRLDFKLRWLGALRAAMTRARAQGKAVVLVGDMNFRHRPMDVYWSTRVVHIPSLRVEPVAGAAGLDNALAAWPVVREALLRKEHRPYDIEHRKTHKSMTRWGVFVRSNKGKDARVGWPSNSEEKAKVAFAIDGVGANTDGSLVFGNEALQAPHVYCPPDTLSVWHFAEVVKAVAGVEVDAPTRRWIADTFGAEPSPPSIRAWLASLLEEDHMVDSFAELWPNAKDRFTNWVGSFRPVRTGSRVDYIFVDRPFFERHARRGEEQLQTGGGAADFNSEEAAAAASAVESSGRSWGLPKLEENSYSGHFRRPPATGMIYTPPQLSDHIAVSLLLCGVQASAPRTADDAATLQCQPDSICARAVVKRPAAADGGSADSAEEKGSASEDEAPLERLVPKVRKRPAASEGPCT